MTDDAPDSYGFGTGLAAKFSGGMRAMEDALATENVAPHDVRWNPLSCSFPALEIVICGHIDYTPCSVTTQSNRP